MMVSAICPTYNRRRYMPSLITCFLSQTYTDSELLIVDDGTEKIEDLIPNHPRIKYIKLDGLRRTTGEKRNICCENATGEIIIHFDDDDWSALDRIEDQARQLYLSNKQVLTYYNILLWDVFRKEAHCYNPTGSGEWWQYAYGATLCYWKSWWTQNEFEDKMGVEDSYFVKATARQKQLASSDASSRMVLRIHYDNIYSTKCPLWKFPVVETADLPKEFLIEEGL